MIYGLKIVGYIWKTIGYTGSLDILSKSQGYFRQDYGIHRAKILGPTMGYIYQK